MDLSLVGGSSQEYTSVLTAFGFVVFFYLVVNVLSEKQRVIHFILLLSAVLTGVFSILSLFTQNSSFNTIGTINAAGIYLIVMSVFGSALWLSQIKKWQYFVCLPFVSFFYLLIVDYWLLWFLFVLAHVILFVFMFVRSRDFAQSFRSVLPIILVLLSLLFWIWLPSPFSVSVPSEVSPNNTSSTNVAQKTLENFSPFLGSGPGTYAFDFATFHGPEINQTEFFNTRFDRASSYFLTLLPTIGYLGLNIFFIFLFALGVQSVVSWIKSNSREESTQIFIVLIPWLTLIVAADLYPFNFTLVWLIFLFSGLLGSQIFQKSATGIGNNIFLRLLFFVLLTIGTLAFLVGIFFTVQRYIAEVAFAKAVRSDREDMPLSEVVVSLDRAASLNRFDDRFYRTLSQALLLQANDQLKNASSETEFSQKDREYLQALFASSVNAAVRATELSPRNALNWLARGLVYRELINSVSDASKFAIEAYQKAVALEPLNPEMLNELGIAFAFASDDDSAEKTFRKAIELKANYAPAHYQLALLYEKQGRLDDAIGKMESVAKYNMKDVGVAFQLGQLYMRRNVEGDLARAKNAFSYAISLAPSFSNARWFLATIFEQEGNVQAVIEQIQKVLELDPDNTIAKSRLDRLLKGKLSSVVPEVIE
ncbi:tetratricopeptide repeat protein [Candidatus Uhrbacteria bacterium]|nr:tetratricopeptide repeat protein [Candidatus Uhrbacteria bacterium]